MDMNMNNLKNCFEAAKVNDAKYIGVLIQMQGFEMPEVIINQRENFDTKFEYYQKAYNEDLTLKTFNGIKIIGFTHGNTFESIEKDLALTIITSTCANSVKG